VEATKALAMQHVRASVATTFPAGRVINKRAPHHDDRVADQSRNNMPRQAALVLLDARIRR
jgi:hypothetical protein